MSNLHDGCGAHGHGTWSGTWQNVRGDIDRHLTMTPDSAALEITLKRKIGSFLRPEIQSLFFHRLAHYLHVNNWRRLARAISRLNFQLHKINITPQSCIGPRCRLPHPPGVMFHGRAGSDLTIYSLAICTTAEDNLDGYPESGPHLGNHVLLGAHCVLMGPISVGDGSKIVFAVRLNCDVPSGVIALSKVLRLSYQSPDGGKVSSRAGNLATNSGHRD